MTQRKYRDVTADDIGKRIEVTDDSGPFFDANWHRRILSKINPQSKFPFETKTGSVWKYARIEVTE